MITQQPIVKGEKLVNVPRNLWMTSLTAKDSHICGQMVNEHSLDSWKVRPLSLYRAVSSYKEYLLVFCVFWVLHKTRSGALRCSLACLGVFQMGRCTGWDALYLQTCVCCRYVWFCCPGG